MIAQAEQCMLACLATIQAGESHGAGGDAGALIHAERPGDFRSHRSGGARARAFGCSRPDRIEGDRGMTAPAAADGKSSRLDRLIDRARSLTRQAPPAIGIVHPCDHAALGSALGILGAGFARPVLIGNGERIRRAAEAAGVDSGRFEIVATSDSPTDAAQQGAKLARTGVIDALMKGSLHTDELLSAVVSRDSGLRLKRRISHVFVFDVPTYPKLLAIADCVVNISPDLAVKRDILFHSVDCLRRLGVETPHVAVIAAVETPNPGIPATMDARTLVSLASQGEWPGVVVEGPFGLDNAISAESARVKGIDSRVAGNADLLLVPDVNAGNMLYKALVYFARAECAGLVIGARVPVVLTSRADSVRTRICSAALAAVYLRSRPVSSPAILHGDRVEATRPL